MNLSSDMTALIDQLEPISRPAGMGRVLMVMGTSRGAGASTVARELSRLSAVRSTRGVWLFDLDFKANAQAEACRVRADVFDLSLGRETPWVLDGNARLVGRPSSIDKLVVSKVERRDGTRLQAALRGAPDYWSAVRQSIDLAVVDAPGQSRAPMNLVADMDGVILVVDARADNFDGLHARREAIEAAGGVVAGVIVNRAGAYRSAA